MISMCCFASSVGRLTASIRTVRKRFDRRMTAEEIAETLESDVESVNATLQQMKQGQWVIDIDDGHWRATRSRLGG